MWKGEIEAGLEGKREVKGNWVSAHGVRMKAEFCKLAIESGSDSGQRLSTNWCSHFAGRWAGYVRRGRRSMVVRGGVMSQLGIGLVCGVGFGVTSWIALT